MSALAARAGGASANPMAAMMGGGSSMQRIFMLHALRSKKHKKICCLTWILTSHFNRFFFNLIFVQILN